MSSSSKKLTLWTQALRGGTMLDGALQQSFITFQKSFRWYQQYNMTPEDMNVQTIDISEVYLVFPED
jgi:hypothetical protein